MVADTTDESESPLSLGKVGRRQLGVNGITKYDQLRFLWLLAAHHWARVVADQVSAEQYLARRADDYLARLRDRLRVIDPLLIDRHVASVKNPLPSGGEYVVHADGVDTFAHRNHFMPRASWARVRPDSVVAYARVQGDKGFRAERIRLLD